MLRKILRAKTGFKNKYKDFRNKELEAALEFIFHGYTNERDGVTAKVLYKAAKGPSKSRKPVPKAEDEHHEQSFVLQMVKAMVLPCLSYGVEAMRMSMPK